MLLIYGLYEDKGELMVVRSYSVPSNKAKPVDVRPDPSVQARHHSGFVLMEVREVLTQRGELDAMDEKGFKPKGCYDGFDLKAGGRFSIAMRILSPLFEVVDPGILNHVEFIDENMISSSL